ncbi:FKBP-type peptidyl-prolyl cis-trans isomerase [Silvibacterium sp.]|uniref:FKBP-type peptidyl-prolyl cis-trans isomerase n=1 Tax=Silvibacterium sp. TaxID=1964179 RepID=UPI0039E64C09
MQTGLALRYQDLQPGTGQIAQPGWVYRVNYTGWLAANGVKFSSSYDDGGPLEFAQGTHRVIPGWEDGFVGMRVGGRRRIYVPWQLAYGDSSHGNIPPQADLIFDVELVSVSNPNAPPAPPTPPEPAAPPTPATPPTPPAPPQ